MSLNIFNSLEQKEVGKKGVKKVSNTKALILGAALTALQGCGGGGSSSGGNSPTNTAPEIENTSLSYSVMEGQTITKTAEEVISEAGIVDLEGDAILIEVDENSLPVGLSYDSTTRVFTYTGPMVDTSTSYVIEVTVKDSNGNVSAQKVTITFTSVDEADDAPLNVGLLGGPSNVAVGTSVDFSVSAGDADGIVPISESSFGLFDDQGNQVLTSSDLVITKSETNTGLTYDITIPAGLLNTIGTFTLKGTITGIDGGEGSNSGPEDVAHIFYVVEDALAEANYSNFTVTTNSISGDVACSDADGIQSCEYAITLDDAGAIPAYQAFQSANGGTVDFTSLSENTTYRVYTRIYSLNKVTNSYEYFETYKTYTTNTTVTPPLALAPTNLDLTTASDLGASSTDNLTSDNTPTFTWGAVDGATGYKISFDNGTSRLNIGNVLTYTPGSLIDGTKNVKVRGFNTVGDGPATTALPVTIDTVDSVLSSTDKSFTTTVGTALTLETVTATDNVDGTVTVMQSGTVDFNTVGTYNVTYTATDTAGNSATITHTYTVNALPNTVPTGENFSVDALFTNSSSVDVKPYLSDVDGDLTLTATMVGSGVLGGDIVISNAQIVGNTASITVSSGIGNGYIDYQVDDGTDTNPTVYRITINNLNGF